MKRPDGNADDVGFDEVGLGNERRDELLEICIDKMALKLID